MKTPQEKNVFKALAIVGVLMLLWFIIMRRTSGATVIAPGDSSSGSSGPNWTQMFYQTTPGVLDSSVNGGPTFTSNNSVTVNTVDYSGLRGGYFPMFGFVGMTAVGA